MYQTGLTSAQAAAYRQALISDHEVRVRVEILSLDMAVLGSTDAVLSGQVDIDTTSDVDRVCSLELLDPGNSLGLDMGRADEVSAYTAKLLRVLFGIRTHGLDWVQVPVFTGPVGSVRRAGEVLSITAQGLESRLLGKCSINMAIQRGTTLDTTIRKLLRAGGEPNVIGVGPAARLVSPVVLASDDSIWARAKEIAGYNGYRMFYDGSGAVRLSKRQDSIPVCTLDGRWLTGEPSISFDVSQLRNLVVVSGAQVSGKTPIVATAVVPASHPMSPESLARYGTPLYLREDITDQTVTTQARAQQVADAWLRARLQAAVQVEARCLPLPTIEPGDVVRIATGKVDVSYAVQRASIPLAADGDMTVGYTRLVRRVTRGRTLAR